MGRHPTFVIAPAQYFGQLCGQVAELLLTSMRSRTVCSQARSARYANASSVPRPSAMAPNQSCAVCVPGARRSAGCGMTGPSGVLAGGIRARPARRMALDQGPKGALGYADPLRRPIA